MCCVVEEELEKGVIVIYDIGLVLVNFNSLVDGRVHIDHLLCYICLVVKYAHGDVE